MNNSIEHQEGSSSLDLDSISVHMSIKDKLRVISVDKSDTDSTWSDRYSPVSGDGSESEKSRFTPTMVQKNVTFCPMVSVNLIPDVEEYLQEGSLEHIWYSACEMILLQGQLGQELDAVMAHYGYVDRKTAYRKLLSTGGEIEGLKSSQSNDTPRVHSATRAV
jgi:hypothetical protein